MKTLACAIALFAAAGVARADGVNWGSDYAKGLEEAQKSGKLLHVHFYADWCGPCKAMDKEVFHNAEMAKYLNDTFVNVLVDTDKDPETAKKFNVTGIPDSRVLDGTEKEVLRVVGNRPEFFDQMKAMGESAAVEKSLKDNPDSVTALMAAADVYVKVGRLDDACKHLETALDLDRKNATGKRVELWYRLGLAYQAAQKFEEAETAWSEIAKADPKDDQKFYDDVQFARVRQQADDEDWGNAEVSVDSFLKKYPDSSYVPDAKYILGMSEFFNEKKELAISTWKDLMRAHPGTPAAARAEKGLQFAEKKSKK